MDAGEQQDGDLVEVRGEVVGGVDDALLRARRQEAFASEREVLVKARLSGLERIAAVLSREVTRRSSQSRALRQTGMRMTA